VGDELKRARAALAAGRIDEALVLLWMALEPARLGGDNEALAEIAELAGSIPRREAADLVAATGVKAVEAATAEDAPAARERERPNVRSLIPFALGVALIAGLTAFSALRIEPDGNAERPQPARGLPAKITIEADGLYLVPLARYPQRELTDVGLSVIREAGAVDIRSSIGLGPTTYDAERSQFVAEELLRRITESYGIGSGRNVLLVGVTSFDMYERGNEEGPYATVARSGGGRYVVVSTRRFEDDPRIRRERLRAILLDEIRRVGLRPG
jgi:hypothetical protein